MAATGARLTREARRVQLIDLGKQMVEASSFDAVSVDDVAAAAGISRSLLFHYFPTKHDFQVAVAEAGAAELLQITAPDPSLDPLTQLRNGLDRYVDYITQRRAAYLSLVRGTTGGDPAMQSVFDASRRTIAERIVLGLGLDPITVDPRVWIAVRGWIGLVEEAVYTWLTEASVPRTEVIALLLQTLVSMMATVAGISVDDLLESPGATTLV